MAFGWQDQQPYGNLPGILAQIGWDDPNKMDPRNLPQGLLAAAQSPDMPAMGAMNAGPQAMPDIPLPPRKPEEYGGSPTGLQIKGNIDLNNRPVVRNPDGSISTVRSMSFGNDQGETLIPTVAANGSGILSDQAAIDQFRQNGQHLGIFDTPQNATSYAQKLHNAQGAQYQGAPMALQGAQPPTMEGQPMPGMQPQGVSTQPSIPPAEPGFGERLQKAFGGLNNIYGAGLPGDKLIELGAALANRGGWAAGLQELSANNQRSGALKQAQQLQMVDLQKKQAQLLGGASLMKRAYPGMTDAEAQAAAANPAMLSEATKRLNPSESYSTETDADGNIWQTNKMNGQRSLLKPADKAIMGSPDSVPYDSAGRPLGTNTGEPKIARETAQREAEARRLKLDPNDSRTKQFILTGNYPKEPELTSTDKNAILEADDLVSQNRAAIGLLKQAKQVSPRAYGNPVGNAVSGIGSVFGDQASKDTVDLHNIVTGQALASLKTIFGGNPTEGERKILLELQGSGSLPDDVRQKIYDRAIEAAQRRLEFNDQRAGQLRGGSFYKPNNAPAAPAPAAQAPQYAPPAQQQAPVARPSWRIVQ